MKNSQGIKNTQGQIISAKKVRQAEKRKAIKEANEANKEFFAEVMETTEWKPVIRKPKSDK